MMNPCKRTSRPLPATLGRVATALATLLLAAGAQATPLWTSDGTAPFKVAGATTIGAERIRFTADPASVDSPRFELLLGGAPHAAERTHSERLVDGWNWSGRLDGDADQVATLTWSEGRLAGRVQSASRLWEIRPVAAGESLLVEIDAGAFPAERPPLRPQLPLALRQPDHAATPAAANGWRLDVLVTYQPGVLTEAGSLANLRAGVRNFVYGTNVAARDSGFNGRYHLVGLMQSPVADDPDMGVMLPALRTDALTMALRDAVGADLVSLLVTAAEHPDACGLGYMMGNPADSGFAAWAYQVSRYDCARTNFTWAHEHGHNIGMNHDADNAGSSFYPYAYGWGVGGVFRTIMAYAGACTPSCPRVGLFSTPYRSYGGHPAGVADSAENVRVGNNTVPAAAGFRSGNVIFADGYDG